MSMTLWIAIIVGLVALGVWIAIVRQEEAEELTDNKLFLKHGPATLPVSGPGYKPRHKAGSSRRARRKRRQNTRG